MNPYKELGVRKNASKATIKKAYRSKAKIHHPDSKGNVDTFLKLKEAYQVLIDPDRRKKYDETGVIDKEPTERTLEKALELISGGLIEIMKIRNYDENYDYLVTLKQTTSSELEKVKIEISKHKHQIEKLEKISKRSKVKKKAKLKINVFAGAIENHKFMLLKTLEQLNDREKVMIRVADILDDLEYERNLNPESFSMTKSIIFKVDPFNMDIS